MTDEKYYLGSNETEQNESSRPEFWDVRYAADDTPWDFHGVPAAIKAFLGGSQPGILALVKTNQIRKPIPG
jgi:hypothetical protein